MRYEKTIERYLDITGQSGNEFYGRCPFHQDTTPSFAINGKTGLWFCHACGVKGNMDHLTAQLGIDEPTTLASLRDRLDDLRTEEEEPEVLRVLPEAWLSQFNHPHTYWEGNRGISPMTQKAFDLGYDPFWNAVTIPIRNDYGSLLGVIRRRLDEDGPKYVYPKGFSISDQLFASWKIDGHHSVALVEGPIDALACWDSGIPALALYGSRISQRQLKLLVSLSLASVVIMTDNDEAGIKAAEQIITDLQGVGWKFPQWWPERVKDPGDMDSDSLWQVFESAAPTWHLN